MLNQDIQKALQKLDRTAEKRRNKRRIQMVVSGLFMLSLAVGGVTYYHKSVPDVTAAHLSRMIIIASRTSDNDPIRLLGDVERHMGKKLQELSNAERANAMNFLISHIELHHNRQELISY